MTYLELFYRAQYKIFGFNAALFHFVNIMIHTINSFLLYLILLKLPLKEKALCLGVALIFLLHPIQSESVACISGISNVLLAFFLFCSLYSYLKFIIK